MTNTLQTFTQQHQSNRDFSFIKPGVTLRVHQKIKEGKKERVQVFEGMVIAQKHGKGLNGTVTVRKIASGVGVERTFLLHSPKIEKFEVAKVAKVRRSKLYYLREKTAKETRRKTRLLEEQTKKAQAAATAAQASDPDGSNASQSEATSDGTSDTPTEKAEPTTQEETNAEPQEETKPETEEKAA